MKKLTRRQAIARLGIGAALVYTAPTVTRIDTARAAFPSCNFRGNGVGGGCGGGRTDNRGNGNGNGRR